METLEDEEYLEAPFSWTRSSSQRRFCSRVNCASYLFAGHAGHLLDAGLCEVLEVGHVHAEDGEVGLLVEEEDLLDVVDDDVPAVRREPVVVLFGHVEHELQALRVLALRDARNLLDRDAALHSCTNEPRTTYCASSNCKWRSP